MLIKEIIDPLRIALVTRKSSKQVQKILIEVAGKIPSFGKKNLTSRNEIILFEKIEYIITHHHNPIRNKMVEAGGRMLVSEYGHDQYYAFFMDRLFIEIALEIARGNWEIKNREFAWKDCWSGEDLPDIDTVRQEMKKELEA